MALLRPAWPASTRPRHSLTGDEARSTKSATSLLPRYYWRRLNPRDADAVPLLDVLLLPAFYLALRRWVVVSLVLLLRGLSGGRRALALARARQQLRRTAAARSRPRDRRARRARRDAARPRAACAWRRSTTTGGRQLAEAIVARLGRESLSHWRPRGQPRQNNRRIAAMQVLTLARVEGVTTLLARAIDDRDQEIVGAALALLGRVPDETAAAARSTPSRRPSTRRRASRLISTASSVPIGPTCGRCCTTRTRTSATGARRCCPGIRSRASTDLAALPRTRRPLSGRRRWRAWPSLAGRVVPSRRLACRREWYVRAHAARALASTGDAEVAEEIAPLLADREWWVRLAAKESLQRWARKCGRCSSPTSITRTASRTAPPRCCRTSACSTA